MDYLAEQISAEEDKLKQLKEKCHVTTMEEQLARLRLQSAESQVSSGFCLGGEADDGMVPAEGTGVAAGMSFHLT